MVVAVDRELHDVDAVLAGPPRERGQRAFDRARRMNDQRNAPRHRGGDHPGTLARASYPSRARTACTRGRVRHASKATTSARAAMTLPKISNVGRRPSGVTRTPAAIAGSDSEAYATT